MHPFHRCRLCQRTKPRDQFHVDRSRKDGLANLCKDCVAEKNASYRANNRDRCNAASKRWHEARPTYVRDWKRRRKRALNPLKETQ